MKKDLRELMAQVERQGFTWRLSTKGHVLVQKDGRTVAVFSGTPSDFRAWRNSLSDLKRAGFRP